MTRLFPLLVACLIGPSASGAPLTALAYHPQGKILAVGSYGDVHVIDPTKGDLITTIKAATNRVTMLAFTPQGDRLAIASGEPGKTGAIHLYEVKDGKLTTVVANLPNAHKDVIYTLTFSPDGKLFATAGYDRVIKIWNTADPKNPQLLEDHSDAIHGLSFHPDGKLLASAAADRAVKIWSVETNKRLYTLNDPIDGVYSVAFSPDGKHLAAAGIDKSIRVWEANTEGGKLVHSVFAHTQPVTRILYSRDGKTLYSISEGMNIKAWSTATMKEIFVSPAQTETMLAIALSPDQKQLAVGFFDGKLKLLEADTGKTTAEPLPAKPKPPELKKLTPNAGLPGKTTRVMVEGVNLGEVNQIVGDAPGLQTKIIAEGRTATRLEVDVTLPPDVTIGTANLSLKSPAGVSANLPFHMDRYPIVVESGPKDSPRIGLKVNLPATLVGAINKAGDADYFRFEAKQGQDIAVQALVVGSKLEPIIELTDTNGKVLTESANGRLGYHITTTGFYALGIRDKDFRGGSEFTYRLSVGEFPLLSAIFPLGVQRGQAVSVKLLGVNLPPSQRTLTIDAPNQTMVGARIRVPIETVLGKPVGDAQVVVGEFPETIVDSSGAKIPVPGTANGIIDQPSSFQEISFNAKKGQQLIVDVEANRLGSPLDSTIEILDAGNLPVQRATLRCTARTFSTFRDNDSVGSGIRLEAWNELAMDDYLYVNGELLRIRQLPKGPDDDCQFYTVAGQRIGFLGTTPTHHALGSPMYKVEIHTPGTSFPPNGMPVFNLAYRNDDGGPGHGKDSRLFFDPPADGEYKVRIRDARGQGGAHYAYRMTVRSPRPDFSVKFDPVLPSVWKGGSVPITVTATRLDGYSGPIQVKLDNLPPGFEAPPTFIEADQETTTFPLFAATEAKLLDKATPFKLVARATINGKDLVRQVDGSVPKLVEPGDIITTTAVREVAITPGRETKMLVTIERRNGFAGRIPLEVRGLPHGVRVLNIGLNGILVTERDTQREIVLYAEPWVKPMEHPFIVLAKREGKNTEHGAKSVLLKVAK